MPNERIGVTTTVAAGQDAIGIYPDDAAFIETFPAAGPYLLSDGFSLESPLPVFVSDTPAYRDSAGTLPDAIRVRGISSPASVYGENLRGWWDVQDLSTMYQDRAGTVPVTEAGQVVGLHLSKDSRGFGPDLRHIAITGMVGVATPAIFDSATGAGSVHRVTGDNTSYIDLTPPTFNRLYVWDIENLGPGALRLYERNKLTIVKSINAGERHRIYATSPTSIVRWRLQTYVNGESASFVIHSMSECLSAHRIATNDANRPLLQWDANAAAYYLLANGRNTHMAVPSLDLTNTDEVGLFYAFLQSPSTNLAVLLEFGLNRLAQFGCFGIASPTSAGGSTLAWESRGTSTVGMSYNLQNLPVRAVLAATASISSPLLTLSVNNIGAQPVTTSQGTGSFNSLPLYFYQRGNASDAAWSGHDYGLHLIDRLPTDAEAAWSSAHLNAIIKAY